MKLAPAKILLLGVLVVAISSAVAQMVPKSNLKVLHFYKVKGFNHKQGIEGGTKALDNLAAQYGFTLKHSDKEADILTLKDYDVVVFDNNVSDGGGAGILPTPAHQQALVDYLMGGGAYLGFHGASDYDCGGWEWWHKVLYSGNCFKGHGGGAWILEVDADLTEDPKLSKMWLDAGLGTSVKFETEKYLFKGSTSLVRSDTSVQVLQRMSEATQSYPDHYFTWTKPIGQGRMLYTGLGHGASDWTQNDKWLEKATWHWMNYLVAEANGSPVTVSPKGAKLINGRMGGETGSVILYDVHGKLVATHKVMAYGEPDYSTMAKSGLYFAKIQSLSGQITTKKVVIP